MGVVTKELKAFPREFANSVRMNKVQFMIFLTSWWSWTLGSLLFYILPYTQPNVAKTLGVEQSKIAQANTTSLLARALGALIFGVLSDQYGRKIPLLAIIALMGVFTLCSGFVKTYGQFVGTRLLFGIAYGGLYGPNMAALLEALPREQRGPLGGFTQQGFSAGNLLASGLHLAMNRYSWRALYYLGAGLSISAFALRLFCPSYSVTEDAVREVEGIEVVDDRAAVGGNLSFWTKFKYSIRHHWPVFIYCAALAACFNTLGHGHLDVYPTYLETQRGISVLHETWVTCVLQSGGVLGGFVGGYVSRYSVKWVPMTFAILMGPLLPALILPSDWRNLMAGAFFFEFCYGAAISTVGNILQIICPHPGIRGAFGGVTYNIGNAISSIAPSIETALGERFKTSDGKADYGRVILILAAIMIGLLSLTLALMPIHQGNMEWDLTDPNQAIPTIEGTGKEIHDEENEKPHDIEEQRTTEGTTPEGTEHVEVITPAGK